MKDAQYRTARRFGGTSPLFRWWESSGWFGRTGNALVVGAGLLVEAAALKEIGWRVDALETPDSIARRPDLYADFATHRCRILADISQARVRYELAVITHVLEFIPDPKKRHSLLSQVSMRLQPEGIVLLSLRGWSDVYASSKWVKSGEGVRTGIGTWTRGFTRNEAEKLIGKSGLIAVGGPQGARSKTPEQVRIVCQRVQ
jgi:hypothetical protein